MGRALFQYGTATHLAILTVVPFFLSVFCGPSVLSLTVFWLSLLAAIWIVMCPSPRAGEWPRDARHRIGLEIVHDPMLAFCTVVLVLSVIRAVNGGVGPEYEPVSGLWHLRDPYVVLLPGSVTGCGVLPLAGSLGFGVVTLGVRHALGKRARFAYLLVSGLLAAVAVVVWKCLQCRGFDLSMLFGSPENPFYAGTLLGVFLLFATTAWIESWLSKSDLLELVAAFSVSVLVTGLSFFAPPHAIVLFGSISLLLMIGGIVLAIPRRTIASWLRSVIALAIILVPLVFLATGGILRLESVWPIFPNGFESLRETASAVALSAWKNSPRLGVGVGAFPQAIGFFAASNDWQVISALQTAAPNGWIHFLFERGILGATVFLVGTGLLIKDMVWRFVRAGSNWSLSVSHFLGPTVLLAVVAVMFVDCSYARLGALVPVGAALALTAAAFPDAGESKHV